MQLHRQLRDSAPPLRPEDDQVRLLGRRDGRRRRRASTKPFWGNFKAFKTMAGEHNDFNIDFGDTIYSDPEVPGAATARTVQQKWRMYRKKLAIQNMQEHPRHDRDLQPLGRPRVHQRLLASPRTAASSTDRSVRAFRDYSRSRTAASAASTGASAGARTWRCSSSTSARSGAPRRRRTARLRQPGHRPAGPGADRAAEHPQRVRGGGPLALPAGLAGLQGQDQQPQPHLPRQGAAATDSCARSRPRTRSGRWS